MKVFISLLALTGIVAPWSTPTERELVRYQVTDPSRITTELYNLKDDIGEQNNLAEGNPEFVNTLLEIMEAARTKSDIFNF